jgi:hypothetical protein
MVIARLGVGLEDRLGANMAIKIMTLGTKMVLGTFINLHFSNFPFRQPTKIFSYRGK